MATDQYGIDLGNILSTAGSIKSAKKNIERTDYLTQRQKELDQLAEAKRNNEGLAKIAIGISQLPPEQQQPEFDRVIASMPQEQQSTIKNAGYTVQDIPYIINDALTLDQVYDRLIKSPEDEEAKVQLEAVKSKYKQRGEEAKQTQKLQLEEFKQEGRQALELIKNQLSGKKQNEFERLMEVLDDPNLPEDKKKRYEARIDKLTQADMSSLLINANTVKNEQANLASDLGLDDPYELSTIDITQLTEPQRAKANQTASIIVKGLGANAKQVEKKMGQYGSMANQMQNSLTHYQDVGKFRAGDELTKRYFSNYFGLSDEEIKSTEAAQALQSMMNIKIKADSGSAVSGQEMVRNVLETATPFMDKDRIILGIKNVAERYKGELESLKNVMGPIAFNLKYGGVLKNYDNIVQAADEAVKTTSSTGKSLEELRQTNPSYTEGQTATNPTTGEKMIFRNGQWGAL